MHVMMKGSGMRTTVTIDDAHRADPTLVAFSRRLGEMAADLGLSWRP